QKTSKVAELEKLPPGDLNKLELFIEREVPNTSPRSVEIWLKQRAWDELLVLVRKQYPAVKDRKEDMERIPADNVEQLVGFVQTGGNPIAQAALSALEPVIGPPYVLEGKDNPKADEVRKFITENYGPSVHAILDKIRELNKDSGYTRDL